MSWKNLIIKYTDFIILLDDIRVLSNLSFQIFHNYPKNIPRDIYEPISKDLSFAKGLVNLHFDKSDKVGSKEEIDPTNFKPKSNLSAIFLESVSAKAIQMMETSKDVPTKKETKTVELRSLFKKIILEQEFLSYYSIFEAFLSNLLTIIFKKYPKKLNPKNLPENESREIRWNDILQFSNYDDLIDFMIEKYIYSFGYKSLYERLKSLKSKKFGFKLSLDKKMKSLLDEIDELRNCLIHNGGRVTNKALKKLNNPDLKAGDWIIITPKTNEDIYKYFKNIVYILYIQTATKHFKKEFENAKKESSLVKFLSDQVFFYE